MIREVTTAKHKHVATVTINRPPSNLLNDDILEALGKTFEEVGKDRSISVVVVTGGDKVFSEGIDLDIFNGLSAKDQTDFIRKGQEVVWTLEHLPKPTIAAMAGVAMNAGLELALACDLRLAGDDAQFGHQEVTKGTMPFFGNTFRLERLVGKSKARALIYFGEPIPAWEALEMGLIGKVAPKDMVLEEARISAARIASQPVDALIAAKRAMLGMDDLQCKEALASIVKSFTKMRSGEKKTRAKR